MTSNPIIDLATYEALKESMGADFLPELLQAYFEETPQLFARLQRALESQDPEAFRQAAHSIKSTSKSFGALEFGEKARQLEMMGRAADLGGAPALVAELLADYAGVRQALEDLSHG